MKLFQNLTKSSITLKINKMIAYVKSKKSIQLKIHHILKVVVLINSKSVLTNFHYLNEIESIRSDIILGS